MVKGMSALEPRLRLVICNPPTVSENLSYEKEVLGTFLSVNLLKVAEEKLGDCTKIAEIDVDLEGTVVRTGGVIMEVKELTTKKGDKMARIKVADVSGSISVVVFPRQYANFKQYLVTDSILTVKGKVQVWDEEVELLAESLGDVNVDEHEPQVDEMKIFISMIPTNNRAKDNMTYMKICNIIKEHSGPDPVILRAVDKDGMIKPRILPLKFSHITWDSLIEDSLRRVDPTIQISTIEG